MFAASPTPHRLPTTRLASHPSVSERPLQTPQLHVQMSRASTVFEKVCGNCSPSVTIRVLAKRLRVPAFFRRFREGLETTKMTRNMWGIVLAAALAVPTASAFAQNPFMPKMSLGDKEKKPLTPEEQERQKQLDQDYKTATKKIPDQTAADPWASVRPTPIGPAAKKKQQ
jgi:hypothetical protein